MLIASLATINRFRAVLMLCTLCWVLPLSAATINLNSAALFNTGVDNTGTALANGSADTHWQCSVNCSGNSFQALSNNPGGSLPTNWPLPPTQNTTPGVPGNPWVSSVTSSG